MPQSLSVPRGILRGLNEAMWKGLRIGAWNIISFSKEFDLKDCCCCYCYFYLFNILPTILPCSLAWVKIVAKSRGGIGEGFQVLHWGQMDKKIPWVSFMCKGCCSFCSSFLTPITHFLSSHASRSFLGAKKDPFKSFQKPVQIREWVKPGHTDIRANMGQGSRGGKIVGRVPGFPLTPVTAILVNENTIKGREEFSLESLIHSCSFLSP